MSAALQQIRESITGDLAAGRTFGWITRLRQIEELYMRCVYVLLLSPDDEVSAHLLWRDAEQFRLHLRESECGNPRGTWCAEGHATRLDVWELHANEDDS